jgi:hypothetical protein
MATLPLKNDLLCVLILYQKIIRVKLKKSTVISGKTMNGNKIFFVLLEHGEYFVDEYHDY